MIATRFCRLITLSFIVLLTIVIMNPGLRAEENKSQNMKGGESLTAPQPSAAPSPEASMKEPDFSIVDKQYVFNVAERSRDELLTVLRRVDKISANANREPSRPGIVFLIEEKAVHWFDQNHYAKNKELIDLAAKLDALNVIDVKISEQSLRRQGIQDDAIPEFAERVPSTQEELSRLQSSGYFVM